MHYSRSVDIDLYFFLLNCPLPVPLWYRLLSCLIVDTLMLPESQFHCHYWIFMKWTQAGFWLQEIFPDSEMFPGHFRAFGIVSVHTCQIIRRWEFYLFTISTHCLFLNIKIQSDENSLPSSPDDFIFNGDPELRELTLPGGKLGTVGCYDRSGILKEPF